MKLQSIQRTNSNNSLVKILGAAISIAIMLILLTACGGSADGSVSSGSVNENGYITVANSPDDVTDAASKGELAAATGFTFDFESLEYSFTGVDNAEFYYIRVYPIENGAESNSASFQSDKIDAAQDGGYSGRIEGETLLAGDYAAYVIASASGYTSSETSVNGTSTLLAAASLSASWNTDGDNVTADITVTAGDSIATSFTLVITDESGAEVYRDDDAEAGELSVTAEMLGVDTLTTEDVYNVTVSINEVPGYTLPSPNETTAQITEAMMFGPPM